MYLPLTSFVYFFIETDGIAVSFVLFISHKTIEYIDERGTLHCNVISLLPGLLPRRKINKDIILESVINEQLEKNLDCQFFFI